MVAAVNLASMEQIATDLRQSHAARRRMVAEMEREGDELRRTRAAEVVTDWISDSEAWHELSHLMREEERLWGSRLVGLKKGGDYLNGPGGIALLEGNLPSADVAAVTGGTVNVALFQSAAYTPIFAGYKAPLGYDLEMAGVVTSSAASQTIIHNPHIGAASTNTVGTNLTASAAQTLGSTITNAVWSLDAQLTLRTSGSGTTATAIGKFVFMYTTVANAGAPTTYLWRSTANATFDSSALNGLVWGFTPSAAGVSMSAQQIRWVSY